MTSFRTFADPLGVGRPTHFIDTAHEWAQRDAGTCVCARCGVTGPMAGLSSVSARCVPSLSPVSFLPLKEPTA